MITDKDNSDQRKGKALTLSTRKPNQQNQNGKKTHQNVKMLHDQKNARDKFDDHKCVTHKKSIPPLKVTESNIDSFLNQLNDKPRPVTKKYTTRSSVKQSQAPSDKKLNKEQEDITSKKQPNNSIVNKTSRVQHSYQSASPVVKLQQTKRNRVPEVPNITAIGLSAFDFDDDNDQPLGKKPRKVNTSTSSSCNSSLEMSRLNASLLARGNTSKSFSMTPQKKTRNPKGKRRQSSYKKPLVSI